MLNLYQELRQAMTDMAISERIISRVLDHPNLVKVNGLPPEIQRPQLAMSLYSLLVCDTNTNIPTSMKVVLNSSTDPKEWLDDIRLSTLVFIKENESIFNF